MKDFSSILRSFRPSQIYDDQATPITAEIPEKKKKAGEKAVEKIEVEVD